ncbi:hypothetical protein [Bacillus phage vB_BanS-Thrax3]|nr:hypothetical protein [Bacillus phage vB_BanS-Thrax1]UUV46393.1 hypothetical protein [Bacillus phage vB_BanS-Thrax3]
MEMLLWLVGAYMALGLSQYAYAVLKSWEQIGFWDFSIKDGLVAGWIRYPKWSMWWIEKFIDVLTGRTFKDE